MFCFTFVSDHNTDFLMLYSVQLENMYSYLNSSLKLSDIVRGLSCQRSGSVVECLTRDRGAVGSSLTGVTALWSLSKTHLS